MSFIFKTSKEKKRDGGGKKQRKRLFRSTVGGSAVVENNTKSFTAEMKTYQHVNVMILIKILNYEAMSGFVL